MGVLLTYQVLFIRLASSEASYREAEGTGRYETHQALR